MRVFEIWGDLIRDGIARLRRAWGWFVAQFFGLALLIALGLLWTRIPEKYGWQVALTLVLPALILLAFLVLQAGTLRAWLRLEPVETTDDAADPDEDDEREPRRVRLFWGALTLVIWIALGWAAWIGLDRAGEKTFQWAAYLNSKFGPHARATWASFDHLNRDLEWALWTVRWIVVPGLLIPLGCCSAAWGLLRMPWRRGLRVWGKWNWWPVVAIWALIAVAWPQTWFAGLPHGTVHAQIWHVLLKIAAAYLLAVTGWNKVLAWSAMLVSYEAVTTDENPILIRLRNGRRWTGGLIACMLLSILTDLLGQKNLGRGVDIAVSSVLPFVLLVAALVLAAGFGRAMVDDATRRVRFVWGVLSLLSWGAVTLGGIFAIDLIHADLVNWAATWILLPIIVFPFAIASCTCGFRFDWPNLLNVLFDWRWWFGAVLAALAGSALPNLMVAVSSSGPFDWEFWLERLVRSSLFLFSALTLVAWFAILLNQRTIDAQEGGFAKLGLNRAAAASETVVSTSWSILPEAVPDSAPTDGTAGRPLPKGSEDAGGNA